MAMDWIRRAAGLLNIKEIYLRGQSDRGGSGRRGGFGGGGDGGSGSDLRGWALKDISGNSSAAISNRKRWSEQAKEKTKDEYNRDPANAGVPYDEDEHFQDAFEKYRPDLSSSAKAGLDRKRESEKKDAQEADKALKEEQHVDHMKAGAEAAGETFTPKDEKAARDEFKEDGFDYSAYTKQDKDKPATKGDVDEKAEEESSKDGDGAGEGNGSLSATQSWVKQQIEEHDALSVTAGGAHQ
jgi:hypothetical protein